jgi:hypothetical protein
MTVGLRDSIRERDVMNSKAPGFPAVKRRVAALIKMAAARLAERSFDPALPPKVHCSMDLCDWFDSSSLGISADDFVDFFCDLFAPQVMVPPDPVRLPSCPSDFRPITIVSVLSKGFERLINGQVLALVDRSGLLSEFQSGFRCGHSITYQVFKP